MIDDLAREAFERFEPRRYHGNESAFMSYRLSYDNGKVGPYRLAATDYLDHEDYRTALKELGGSIEIIADPESGKEFEFGTIGNGSLEDGEDLEISTYNSALTTNTGNAVEFAENAAINPGRPRNYIASPGNGFSSYFGSDELKHLKKHGRLTWYDRDSGLTPLPTIQALCHALKRIDIFPTRLSGNSAGGNIITAMMAGMPEGQVTHAYIKGRPNIVGHSVPGLAVRMLLLENSVQAGKNKENSRDPWALTDGFVEEADKLLAGNSIIEKDNGVGTIAMLGHLASYAKALGVGPGTDRAPATMDTNLALDRQPNAKMTFHFGVHDSLYKGNHKAIAKFFASVAAHRNRQAVEALIMPGSHADHTYTPSVRWAAEKYAFER